MLDSCLLCHSHWWCLRFVWKSSYFWLETSELCISSLIFTPWTKSLIWFSLRLQAPKFLKASQEEIQCCNTRLKLRACSLDKIWFVYSVCTGKQLVSFIPTDEHYVYFYTLMIYTCYFLVLKEIDKICLIYYLYHSGFMKCINVCVEV